MSAALDKANYFTTLDLKSCYWQISLNEEDKEKNAFTCHRGLYEYNVKTFGLANTPGIFQKLISIGLQSLGDFSIAYAGDIIIFSTSEEEHKQHIHNFLIALGNTTENLNCQNVSSCWKKHSIWAS